ncbi:quinone oxidoreductase family protein [Streptomyces sp. 3214.6]|uniref:quinone oxidoreductase family protein n=1 Tax=Streptomyces sp. 3214.6 TaxID=1882757 RepID=UPI001E498874|nr:zinc-binding dehydrogenase [Streptomyces sp. 3214.6]
MMTDSMPALVGGVAPDWELRDVPVPTPEPGQVLVCVHAAGINRADLLMLEGTYNPGAGTSSAYTAGLELAGEVVALGKGVTSLAVGDRIMGVTLGTFARYALLDHRHLVRIPEPMGWTDAAALPVGLLTGHDALVTQAGFTAGQDVLILGATTAVGLLAVQLAKALGAGTVIGTTTSAGKADVITRAGADLVIDTSTTDLRAAVLEATSGVGVDIVLDHLGGEPFASCLGATRIGGTVVNIGRLAGQHATIDLNELAFRRLRVRGTTFSVRGPDELAAAWSALATDVSPLVADGRIEPVIDRVFPLADAKAAADHLRANRSVGKVVLQVPQ